MLMEHNKEAYEQFKVMLLEHHECLLIAATGVGKSNITTELIKELNLNVLVIAPLKSIKENWSKMPEKYGIPTEINTITYNYFSRHWKNLYGFDAYIFDEAHHSGSKIWGREIEKFRKGLNDEFIIGLTADPNRYSDKINKSVIESVYHNHVVYGLDQREAIDNGILPKATYVCALYDTNSILQEYKDKPISDELYGRLCYTIKNCEAIEVIMHRHIPKNAPLKGIVFVDSINNIDMGVKLARRAFPKEAICHIHSNLNNIENKETLDMFEQSKSGFIVTVDMLNEGLHINGVNIIIMLRKTQSPSIYMQQIGRGLAANSRGVTIYDLVRNDTSIKKVLARIHEFELVENDESNNTGKERNVHISDQTIVRDYATDILSILNEIDEYENKRRKWTKSEDKIIIENYPHIGRKCSKLLNRSENACFERARFLGVSKSLNIWTEEEDNILRENYPNLGGKVSELLSSRTKDACISRAIKLGLRFRPESWSEEEISILRKYYASLSANGIKDMLPNRTISAIRSMANKLNINVDIKLWTEEEDNIIREYYPTGGTTIQKLLPNRTKSAIIARAERLNIKIISKYWTEEEDKILEEYYPSMGSNVVALLPNRSPYSCIARANSLGIKYSNSSRKWTNEEDNIIRENYPNIGTETVKLLPGRTIEAVKTRAKNIGIFYSARIWTTDEDKLLKRNYPVMGEKCYVLFDNRTPASVKSRAVVLGIVHDVSWSTEEDNILRENYQKIGGNVYKMLLGRTKQACYKRAIQLGLKFKK